MCLNNSYNLFFMCINSYQLNSSLMNFAQNLCNRMRIKMSSFYIQNLGTRLKTINVVSRIDLFRGQFFRCVFQGLLNCMGCLNFLNVFSKFDLFAHSDILCFMFLLVFLTSSGCLANFRILCSCLECSDFVKFG